MRLNRWLRGTVLLVAVCLSALCLAWDVVTWRLERDPSSIRADVSADSFMPSSDFEEPVSRARYHLRALMVEGNIPAVAVAVSHRGGLVWSEALGYADVESRRPANRQTRFRIQSLSKTLTASALLRLVEVGIIRLELPVQDYVPSFPAKGFAITPLQLASHRSGLRNYRDDLEAATSRHCASALEGIAPFKDDPLLFAPDTDSLYSSYGYVLLGAVLEGATHQLFPDLMRQHVFAPLGMAQTTAFRLAEPHPLEATAYDFVTPYSSDGSRVRSPAIDFSCKWPSGGFLSTADDMARFAAAHSLHTAVSWLTTQSRARQFTPRTPPHSPVGVGLGWLVGRDWRLRRVVFNFGAGSGGRAFLALYPGEDVAVAVLANLGHARMDMRRLIGIAAPFLRPTRAPAPEVASLLVGIGWVWWLRRRRGA